MDSSLTYDKLVDVLAANPPLPFLAFTFNSAAYNVIQKTVERSPLDGGVMFNGVEAWEVRQQIPDCIQWNDEKWLRIYLKYYGVISSDDSESAGG